MSNVNGESVLLDLYIPKMSLNTREENIKDILFHKEIGVVDYCDLVIVKNKETKEPQHMSAFVKLISWNPFSTASSDFEKNGSLTVFLTPKSKEYWKIYPNTNPIPRTHVNISQLAASSEKLFEQQEKTDEAQKEMRLEMEKMKELIRFQQEKIDQLENRLSSNEHKMEFMFNEFVGMVQNLLPQRPNTPVIQSIPIHRTLSCDQSELEGPRLSLSDLDSDSNSEKANPEEGASKKLYNMRCRFNKKISEMMSTKSELRTESIQNLPLTSIKLPDEDDCIFSKKVSVSIPRLNSVANVVPAENVLSNEEKRSVSPENSVRASISRDFCGNH